MDFTNKLSATIKRNNSLLCVGLDTDIAKLPASNERYDSSILLFNKNIIDKTSDLVCCYKFQIAYYSALGSAGLEQLSESIKYIHSHYPGIPVILDAKRADIGSTSELYAKEAFDVFNADAVTVNPYLGLDGLEPFLVHREKGIIVLCRTSNPGAKDFQDLITANEKLFIHVARNVSVWHEKYNNCLLVIGATYPEEMKSVRQITDKMFFLVPGIGAQGGDLKATLEAGLRDDKSGLIIHSSRNIIYASNGPDYADKAREEAMRLRDDINKYRGQES